MDWEAALTYCENLELADRSDWRLPNRKALGSLLDYSRDGPALDTYYFPGVVAGQYWSSTSESGPQAWQVDFNNLLSSDQAKTNLYNVRCVRGGK